MNGYSFQKLFHCVKNHWEWNSTGYTDKVLLKLILILFVLGEALGLIYPILECFPTMWTEHWRAFAETNNIFYYYLLDYDEFTNP